MPTCNHNCPTCPSADTCEYLQAIDNEVDQVVETMRQINHNAPEPAPGTAELAWAMHRVRTVN